MYPLSNLQQIKDENLQQELAELENKMTDLERYHNFAGVNDFLGEGKLILANQKNIEIISQYVKKADDLIESIRLPIKERNSQVITLKKIIEKYFDPSEVQSLNSSLTIMEKKIKDEMDKNSIDLQEVNKNLSQIDLISHRNLKKILGKIKQSLQEKVWNPRYEDYLDSQLKLISLSEKEIKEKSVEIYNYFYIINFINYFEISHEAFLNLTHCFNDAKNKYHKLTDTLFNSDILNSGRNIVEYQIGVLTKKFDKFDPRAESFDALKQGLQDLDYKLNELQQLNQVELQIQQAKYIKLIVDSKQNLSSYAEKLSLLKSKCAYNKSEQLNSIIQKIDLLLNSEINQEGSALNPTVLDNITVLQQTIKEAKSILSEYRGISLLRCFATLWCGGKVTSQLLVHKLEEQLSDFQGNINMISPSR